MTSLLVPDSLSTCAVKTLIENKISLDSLPFSLKQFVENYIRYTILTRYREFISDIEFKIQASIDLTSLHCVYHTNEDCPFRANIIKLLAWTVGEAFFLSLHGRHEIYNSLPLTFTYKPNHILIRDENGVIIDQTPIATYFSQFRFMH